MLAHDCVDRTLGTGGELYHHSRDLEQLLESGRFDPAYSEFGGRIFFSSQQTPTSNCAVGILEPLEVIGIEPVGRPAVTRLDLDNFLMYQWQSWERQYDGQPLAGIHTVK